MEKFKIWLENKFVDPVIELRGEYFVPKSSNYEMIFKNLIQSLRKIQGHIYLKDHYPAGTRWVINCEKTVPNNYTFNLARDYIKNGSNRQFAPDGIVLISSMADHLAWELGLLTNNELINYGKLAINYIKTPTGASHVVKQELKYWKFGRNDDDNGGGDDDKPSPFKPSPFGKKINPEFPIAV